MKSIITNLMILTLVVTLTMWITLSFQKKQTRIETLDNLKPTPTDLMSSDWSHHLPVPNNSSVSKRVKTPPVGMTASPKDVNRQVAYFMQSPAIKTVEGQQIAMILLTNGCDVGFVTDIYSTIKFMDRFGEHVTPVEGGYTREELIQQNRESRIYALMDGANIFHRYKFPDRGVLEMALKVAIPKEASMFPPGTKAIQFSEDPSAKLLTGDDVLKYIQEHPAIPTVSSGG